MRTETLWGGERREARMHWWQEVLDRPAAVDREGLFDEVLCHRFRFVHEGDGKGRGDDRQMWLSC